LLFSYGLGKIKGSFLWADIITLIKFYVVLDKRPTECYRSLTKGLGTHSPSQETVCPWVNDIKNGWAETDNAPHCAAPTSTMDEHHAE